MKHLFCWKCAALVVLAAAVSPIPMFGTDPASQWNVDGQQRTRHCVKMAGTFATLRFPDASPTGFFVQASDPSANGSGPDCQVGYMEMDAQEILYTGDGKDLYFHPGGGGNEYVDEVNNGQYGHVWVTDIASGHRPTLAPQNLNGKPCTASTTPGTAFSYYITPSRIPSDMWYKPPGVVGNTGARWWTYGNPGFDKTGGRGDWTYIVWSVVQNGSSGYYPADYKNGGGLVRALGKRDKVFHRCDISKIVGNAYGANDAKNGVVTNIYGKTRADATGSWIYGWLVHSYQRTGGPLVPCVRSYP